MLFYNLIEYEVLQDAGKVSAAIAKKLASTEYKKYSVIQDRNYLSDFDKTIDEIKKGK